MLLLELGLLVLPLLLVFPLWSVELFLCFFDFLVVLWSLLPEVEL